MDIIVYKYLERKLTSEYFNKLKSIIFPRCNLFSRTYSLLIVSWKSAPVLSRMFFVSLSTWMIPHAALSQSNIPNAAKPRYSIVGNDVVQIQNLSLGCSPTGNRVAFDGEVASVKFSKKELLIQGFTLAYQTGTRVYVNVDHRGIDDRNLSRLDVNWISSGLTRLIKERNLVRGVYIACGASGNFLYLDEIALSTSQRSLMPNSEACRKFPNLCQ
jgi:hypothetical protein